MCDKIILFCRTKVQHFCQSGKNNLPKKTKFRILDYMPAF